VRNPGRQLLEGDVDDRIEQALGEQVFSNLVVLARAEAPVHHLHAQLLQLDRVDRARHHQVVAQRDPVPVLLGGPAVDPFELEKLRMEVVNRGFSPGQNQQIREDLFAESLFDSITYVTFQELATRISHRNTGKACNETIADQLLAKISADENLHMIFYRDVTEAGFEIAPNQVMKSLHKVLRNFQMPGYQVPEFRRKAVMIAVGGVYDPRIHLDDVVKPVLKKWRIFEREEFTGEAAEMRDDLGKLIEELEETCEKFEEAKQRRLERERKVAEKKAAKNLLVASSAS
jgi:acyl-[acyl-carrier-protein] desaturase